MTFSFTDFKCANSPSAHVTYQSSRPTLLRGEWNFEAFLSSSVSKLWISSRPLSLLFSFQDGNVKNSNVAVAESPLTTTRMCAESPVNGGGLDILSLPEVRASAVPFIVSCSTNRSLGDTAPAFRTIEENDCHLHL